MLRTPMPELPEVEISLRAILPHIIHKKVSTVILRRKDLRLPMPQNLQKILKNQPLINITRRAKYLLLHFPVGTLILHLGMSGRLSILHQQVPHQKHDHVDIKFSNDTTLRFRDPRRFGLMLFTQDAPEKHPLLAHLGLEPFSKKFNGRYLFARAKNKKVAVKNFIMDSRQVVGVGNIYASEALFLAGIHPLKPAGDISLQHYDKLATAIKLVLRRAIKVGGTTLRDFASPSGELGYFVLKLNVYGRHKQACVKCGSTLKHLRIGQRSTVYCDKCQR